MLTWPANLNIEDCFSAKNQYFPVCVSAVVALCLKDGSQSCNTVTMAVFFVQCLAFIKSLFRMQMTTSQKSLG